MFGETMLGRLIRQAPLRGAKQVKPRYARQLLGPRCAGRGRYGPPAAGGVSRATRGIESFFIKAKRNYFQSNAKEAF